MFGRVTGIKLIMELFLMYQTVKSFQHHTFQDIHHPNAKLGCFGDFDNIPPKQRKHDGRLTDIVVHDGRYVSIYEQNKRGSLLKHSNVIDAGDANSIKDIICSCDFNNPYDYNPDLVIVKQNSVEIWQKNGEQSMGFTKHEISGIDPQGKPILILDSNGDYKLDIFGWNGNKFGIWEQTGNFVFQFKEMIEHDILPETVSFIDMNQNCRPDLVYMASDKTIKFIDSDSIPSTPFKTFDISATNPNPENRIMFADVNKDGAMDIIIPEAESTTLHIYKQTQKKQHKKLCDSDKLDINFVHETVTLNSQYKWDKSIDNWLLIGDFTLDREIEFVGYTIKNADNSKAIISNSNELNNIFKDINTAGLTNIAFYHSGNFPFGMYFILEYKDAGIIKFKDYKGILDEKYFLSISQVVPPKDAKTKRYGAIIPGATSKVFFHDPKGRPVFLNQGLMYQTNRYTLLTPFNIFGLGKVDSYIEKIAVSYNHRIGNKKHYFIQNGVPPNSQLYVFPYPLDNPEKWILQTFLNPLLDAKALAIIITVVMIVLGGIWVYLEYKDKKFGKEKVKSNTNGKFFF